jgi:hypothetical protein
MAKPLAGSPIASRAADVSIAASISRPVVTAREAVSKRPESSAAARSQPATATAITAASRDSSGCGSATQTRLTAAPPAISHPIARACSRRPAVCASIAGKVADRGGGG